MDWLASLEGVGVFLSLLGGGVRFIEIVVEAAQTFINNLVDKLRGDKGEGQRSSPG